jgi:hypothetical protein
MPRSLPPSRQSEKTSFVQRIHTVEFWKVRGVDWRKVAEYSGVYVDQLHELIERETGLYTRMRGAASDGASSPRNFGWGDFTHYAQPVMQYVHPVGKAVLGYFGAGAVGDYAEKYEKQYGLLKDDKKPEQKPAPSPPAAKPAPTPAAASSPQRPAAQPARPVQTFLPVRRPISAPPPAQPPPAPPAPAPPSASLIDPYSTQGGPNADDEPETYAFFWPPRRAPSAREAAQAPQRRFW